MALTGRGNSKSAERLIGVALVLAAGALAGCQTVGGTQTSEVEDSQYAASPANIASLTGVGVGVASRLAASRSACCSSQSPSRGRSSAAVSASRKSGYCSL